MKNKLIIYFLALIVLVFFVLITLFVFLVNFNQNQSKTEEQMSNKTDITNNKQNEDEDLVDKQEEGGDTQNNSKRQEKIKFSAIYLTNQGEIYLSDLNNNFLPISLSKNIWIDPKWNFSKTHFAVLKEESVNQLEKVKNLFLYSIKDNKFIKISNFNSESNSISKFWWIDDENIYFFQEASQPMWVNVYNINSNNILKLFNTFDSFLNSNFSRSFLVFENNDFYVFKDRRGNNIFEIQKGLEINGNVFVKPYYITNNLILLEFYNKETNSIELYIRSNLEPSIKYVKKRSDISILNLCIPSVEQIYGITRENGIVQFKLVNTLDLGWNLEIEKVYLEYYDYLDLVKLECQKDAFSFTDELNNLKANVDGDWINNSILNRSFKFVY